MKKLFYISLLSSFLTTLLFATEKIPTAVDDYAKSLQLTRSKKAVSIEQTYIKGLAAFNSVEDSLARSETEIDSKWLKSLRAKMEGFELYPNPEANVGYAKSDFFLQLAKKNGTASDVAFFELNAKTYPRGIWAVYLQQRTDFQGCTIYDGSLTKLYKSWSDFQKKYPSAYSKITKEELVSIEKELSESACSCAEKADPIVNELQSFIKENSKSKLVPIIQKRINDIKSKVAPIPGCNIDG